MKTLSMKTSTKWGRMLWIKNGLGMVVNGARRNNKISKGSNTVSHISGLAMKLKY